MVHHDVEIKMHPNLHASALRVLTLTVFISCIGPFTALAQTVLRYEVFPLTSEALQVSGSMGPLEKYATAIVIDKVGNRAWLCTANYDRYSEGQEVKYVGTCNALKNASVDGWSPIVDLPDL